MNRASVIAELARVLQVNETEAERLLRAFAQVLGPIAAEVPPYFERYFEAQIQRVLQSLADFKEDTNRRFEEVNRNFAAFREDTNRRFEEVNRSLAEFKEDTNRRFEEVNREIANLRQEMERRFDRMERWVLGFMTLILAAVLAGVFKLYFGG